MEIERKWLFDINKVPTYVSKTVTYYGQSYLSIEPEVRIREKQIENLGLRKNHINKPTYALAIKGNGTISRHEIQKELTKEEYEALKEVGNIIDEIIIRKRYYTIPIYDKYDLTVSIVDEGTENEFCYGEIEFESEEEALAFKPLDWFGEEVTYDKNYKMKNYWKRTRLEND